ncbi:ATP-binding protein [Nonomuraea sp. NPDC046802]|uniref:ATP-binding protein n=1 Tax=Nonomuraea sp. NPDC046802 TaxID=3154919 RepID=UPI0033F69F82
MSEDFHRCCPISADLALVRELVDTCGRRVGLSGRRLADLVLAVNEAVTNVLDHGGAGGRLVVRGAGDTIDVEVLDTAGGLTRDHLAGATLDPTASHGFGLWLVQHLCDAICLEQTDAGSRLTLHMHRRPATAVPGRSACRICDMAGHNGAGADGPWCAYGFQVSVRALTSPGREEHAADG